MARQDQEPQDRDAEMYAMARSGTLTDVEFVVGGQVFAAHRLILCAGSSYFQTMLLGPYKEGQSKKPILIPDVKPAIFQSILAFCYTRAADLQGQADVCELLRVAKKYGMDGLVTHCIEAVQNGHINASNCVPLLDVACELGNHGREAPWSSLFKACATYAVANLAEMLDKWDGSPPKLALAGMCRLVELASPKVVGKPLLLGRLWEFVKAWGRDALGAHDLASFLEKVMDPTFEDAEFLDGTDFTFELTGLDSAGIGWYTRKSDTFRAGGFSFSLWLEREEADGEDWYGTYLYVEPRRGEWSPWCCYTLFQFRWLHSSGSPEKDATKKLVDFFAAESESGSGRRLLKVADAHSPGAGYIQDGRATVRATVKVNPLFAFCTAAAFLDNAASPAAVLHAITDVELLRDMLAADSLPVESEDALLAALAEFADSDASEEHAKKVAALVPALRLDDMDSGKLIGTARASPGLRGCEKFSHRLQAYIERALARPVAARSRRARAAQAPRRGAVWRSLQGAAAEGAAPPQPQPPDARAVMRCLLSPLGGVEDLWQPRHASREAQEQRATSRSSSRSRSPRLDRGQRGGEASAA